MQVEEYLKRHQPVIYQTFLNSLQKGHLSHAYLLCGNPGTPLLEVAKYLAKSILCDDPSPLACNSCITCLRVDDDNYPDFIVFNGEQGTIKKEAVTSLEAQFEKKAFEAKGIRIYILHLVENMTDEAVNSLLKFLEEPDSNIYAFLTTNNEANVLPTIVSRCQNLYLKSVDRNCVIKDAIEIGVPQDDAEFLSYFYNDALLIDMLSTKKEEYEQYEDAKKALLNLVNALNDSPSEAIFTMQAKVEPLVKNKESCRFFIDMLTQVIEDVVSITVGKEIILKSQKDLLLELSKHISKPSEVLVNILKTRSQINLNVNLSLLLDHLIFEIVKE